jgi:EF hand
MAARNWLLAGAFALVAAPALAGPLHASREDFAADRAAAFAQADADGNGALTPAEFQTFRQLLRDRIAQHMFARADADGNGEVTQAELDAARPPHGHCGPPGE